MVHDLSAEDLVISKYLRILNKQDIGFLHQMEIIKVKI